MEREVEMMMMMVHQDYDIGDMENSDSPCSCGV